MKGIIPALGDLACDFGNAIAEILNGPQGTIKRTPDIKTPSDHMSINIHMVRSIKSSNWRRGGKR